MTQKARKLGMNSTVFQNANGLPNPNQRTTARDMAMLGLALREHFPEYYPYFSTRSFKLGKQRIGNHNRLLGRIKGVDGIKTGYTRASGFNLVSSVVDGDRKLVAVVMGGASGRARDDHMAGLIQKYLPQASRRADGAIVASASPDVVNAFAQSAPPPREAPVPLDRAKQAPVVVNADENRVITPPKQGRLTRAEQLALSRSAAESVAPPAVDSVDPIETASVPSSGWAIQVASSPTEREARKFLDLTASKAGTLLASASAFTVSFKKSGTMYYRARFGGFETKSAAWDICGALKRKKISCYAVQQ